MSEIEIPDAAVQAVAQRMYDRYESEYVADHLSWRDFASDARADLEAASGFVVAAELRKLAGAYDQWHEDAVARIKRGETGATGMVRAYGVRDQLRMRADELDPQGGAR